MLNAFGACCTGVVLLVVLITKFTHGAYFVVIAIPVLYALMRSIRRHYDGVRDELSLDGEDNTPPGRVHALVLVSRLHKATMRALAFTRATGPDSLTAITVDVEESETRALQQEWEQHGIAVPLIVIDSPYREIARPVDRYIKSLRRENPRDVICVYIPEYVVGHWWENVLHNQSALRLKARLRFEPGVMVVSVPWQLHSSQGLNLHRIHHSPGDIRRGITSTRTRRKTQHRDQATDDEHGLR